MGRNHNGRIITLFRIYTLAFNIFTSAGLTFRPFLLNWPLLKNFLDPFEKFFVNDAKYSRGFYMWPHKSSSFTATSIQVIANISRYSSFSLFLTHFPIFFVFSIRHIWSEIKLLVHFVFRQLWLCWLSNIGLKQRHLTKTWLEYSPFLNFLTTAHLVE